MKVKQIEAVKAYRSIRDLNRVKLSSGKLAKQIYDLFSQLQKASDFQTQEEQKIFKAHPQFDTMIGGINLEGKSKEEQIAAQNEIDQIEKELKDLSELDFEVDVINSPIEIKLDAEPNIKLSGEDIGNLEKFISFV